MNLAIIGSRNCPPIDIEKQLKYIPDTIVSGGARGAKYTIDLAVKEGKPVKVFNYNTGEVTRF